MNICHNYTTGYNKAWSYIFNLGLENVEFSSYCDSLLQKNLVWYQSDEIP